MAIRKMEVAETDAEAIDRLQEYNKRLGDNIKELEGKDDAESKKKVDEMKETIKENNDKMSKLKGKETSSVEKDAFVKVYDDIYPSLLKVYSDKGLMNHMTSAQKKEPDSRILSRFKQLVKMAKDMEDLFDDILEELDDVK